MSYQWISPHGHGQFTCAICCITMCNRLLHRLLATFLSSKTFFQDSGFVGGFSCQITVLVLLKKNFCYTVNKGQHLTKYLLEKNGATCIMKTKKCGPGIQRSYQISLSWETTLSNVSSSPKKSLLDTQANPAWVVKKKKASGNMEYYIWLAYHFIILV